MRRGHAEAYSRGGKTLRERHAARADSCWSQETEVFFEKIADEVKKFVEEIICRGYSIKMKKEIGT